jgi:hypothetical protein
MIKLQGPSLALNDPRVDDGHGHRTRFEMQLTWDIRANESRSGIIWYVAWVGSACRRQGGTLRHLVLNSHGFPGGLQLGEGFDARHLPMFHAWRGLVGKIWLMGCEVARGPAGHHFVSSLARVAHCHVVASTGDQCDDLRSYPRDHLSSFEGRLRSYDPHGRISWSHRYPSTWDYPDGTCHSNPD